MDPSEKFAHHMSDSDALMWNIEKDPILRSTIVAVGILDREPDFDRIRRRLARASITIPRLRQRVLSPPFRIGPPRWANEANFDLDFHLRRVRLAAPANLRSLLEFVAPIAQSSFDRARPLWEFTIVEGLSGGRAAVVMKVHHSVTDGVGGIDLLTQLVDLERDADEPDVLAEPPAPQPFGSMSLLRDSLDHTTRRWLGISRRIPATVGEAVVTTVQAPLRAAANAIDTARSIGRMLAPATAPLSPLLLTRGLGRRLDTLDVPLDDLKRAAKSVDGSLNDAFVAAVVGGLSRYHARHGAALSELRMTLPINLRTSDHGSGGNQFAPVRFPVPAAIIDPAERMKAIGTLVRSWRAEPALRMTSTLAGVLNRLPTATSTALFGGMLKCVDFVTSNVPGAPIPVFVGGAEIEGFYAFAPPSGSAVNVTLVSHCNQCCIGIVTDTSAVPDPDVLVESIREGFAEIVSLG
jgi:diacylglycerol O-acyltransferase / wax synthase